MDGGSSTVLTEVWQCNGKWGLLTWDVTREPKGSVPGHAQLKSFNSDEEESINC